MTHEELKADLPLFALGSLDPEERSELERHLAEGCASCRGELDEWRRVVDVIPLGAEATEAPDLPDLKNRLLARSRGGEPSRVVPLRRWVAVPLAAAALAILTLAGVREVQRREDDAAALAERQRLERALADAKVEVDQLSSQLTSRESDLKSLRAALASAEQNLALLQSRGLQMVSLRQPAEAAPAEAHLLLSVPAGKGLLYAFDLGTVPSEKIYELWWITEGAGPVMAGLFRPDERGLGRIEAQLPAGVGRIQAAAVTVEPAAGVPKPTGPMVLVGEVKS